MYRKGMSQEVLTDLTKCKYHKKIGTSDDKQYEYYISYQTEDFLKEEKKVSYYFDYCYSYFF